MFKIFKTTIIGIVLTAVIPGSIDAEKIEINTSIVAQEVLESETKTEEDGRSDGEEKAKSLAQKNAQDHFSNNLSLSTERDSMAEGEIIEEYDLDKYGESYKRGFLSIFASSYKTHYTDTYKELLGDSGRARGRVEGEKLAKRDAEEHFHTAMEPDPNRSMLTDDAIFDRYYLSFRDGEYREEFLIAFKEAYTRAYLDEYIQFGEDNQTQQYERARDDGKELGELMGRSYAMIDFSKAEKNDWEDSYARMEEEQSLSSRYRLDKEQDEYAKIFTRWFKSGFASSYTETYRELNLEVGTENIEYRELTGLGDIITLENILGSVIDGSDTVSQVESVSLEIPAGSFYERTYLGISRQKDTFGVHTDGYEPVSDIHSISVSNQSGDISLKEDLILTFKYVGTDRVGIYENIDGRWIYLPTSQEDDKILARIPRGVDYSGGEYALFIDNDYSHFEDIQGNWAREEIYAYLRRGHVQGYGDGTFRPDRKLTRLEFLIISSRVLGWNYKDEWYQGGYRDSDEFADYADLINYATRVGYINGYEDGSFRPNRNISYREIEYLMARITGENNFKWSYFADKMKYERYEYSSSYISIDNNISRVEALYMFYELEKNGKV